MRVNVVALTALTASLKVAVTAAAAGTAVAPATGFVEPTVGRVVSVGAGVLAESPGKVLAVISAMLVNPSPSESRDSTLVILVRIATLEPNDRIA